MSKKKSRKTKYFKVKVIVKIKVNAVFIAIIAAITAVPATVGIAPHIDEIDTVSISVNLTSSG